MSLLSQPAACTRALYSRRVREVLGWRPDRRRHLDGPPYHRSRCGAEPSFVAPTARYSIREGVLSPLPAATTGSAKRHELLDERLAVVPVTNRGYIVPGVVPREQLIAVLALTDELSVTVR